MIIVAPLLVLAAFRGQRWSEPIRLSRAAVFHSATLVLSGSVLLSLALAGEILRHLDDTWGWVAELSFAFSGLICILLFLSSRSAKSFMDRMVVSHFFADRYDYRTQWLSCIGTLSGRGSTEQTRLHVRAIRAIADVVDSPNGTIFIRDDATGSLVWADSWNMPSASQLSPLHPLVRVLDEEQRVVDLKQDTTYPLESTPFERLGSVWLAIPLLHSARMIGIVVVGPPRVAFRIDQEVLDLLGIVGREVGTYIAEQQATEAVFQSRSLHDYGKRFAFVAHDIKNVSSQLALLLSNAEHHLANPEFQRDMLDTVRSSVQKIGRLLNRLDQPTAQGMMGAIDSVAQVSALISARQRSNSPKMRFDNTDHPAWIMMAPEAFDAALTHLVNNAVEAAPEGNVTISVLTQCENVVIEVSDDGVGMSPEFIRDELFSPFRTRRVGGSGIGAFQARELITEAGGELLVTSQKGVGTTMRIVFRLASRGESPRPERVAVQASGVHGG
jgi:putative PEP-CTERM system histidine kinase